MNKYVIVTGCKGGIGTVICATFRSNGWKVIGLDISQSSIDVELDHFVQVDLALLITDISYQKTIISSIQEISKGSLSALINNAAVQRLNHLEDLSLDDWNESLNVNLSAPLLLSKVFLSELKNNQGSIVNIASIHERLTKPKFIAYATSKSALVGLTQAMAVDLGDKVRVNCISPAAVDTPMLKAGFANDPESFQRLKDYHPVKDIGHPKEIANLAFLLCNEDLNFVSGSNFQIDGGISKRLHDPN